MEIERGPMCVSLLDGKSFNVDQLAPDWLLWGPLSRRSINREKRSPNGSLCFQRFCPLFFERHILTVNVCQKLVGFKSFSTTDRVGMKSTPGALCICSDKVGVLGIRSDRSSTGKYVRSAKSVIRDPKLCSERGSARENNDRIRSAILG